MNVGISIKVALAKRGMSQTQLAEQLRCTKVWINRLANSKSASMDTVQRLADAFGLPVSEFIALGED